MEGFKGKGAAQQQQPKCRVCAQNESLYACPKCNCRYCSSKCYRLHGDGTCVEAFHAESLARMMKNEKHFDGDSEDEEEKKREMEAMVMKYERHVEKDEREMRTRFGLEAKSFSPSSSDDDEEEDEEDEEKEDEDEYCTLSAKLMRAYLKEEEDNKFSGISERDFAASDKKRLERMLRKGEIRVEPWRAWWTIEDDDEVLLRDDGTAKIVALNDDTNNNNDDDNDNHPSSVLGFPSPPTEPLPSYWSLLPPTKRTLKKVSAKQRNVFRETVAGAITLYAIIARAFNGDHACFDAAATYLMHHHHQNDTNKNNNNEEDKEEEETNDSVNALLALHVSAVINTHTLVPSGLFYDTSKSGKVAKNLESDAYAMLRSRSKRVLAMEDLRSMFRKAIEDSYYDDDGDDTTTTNKKKNINKEFRSKCRKMERKLFFAECFANVTDEEFFAANSVADDEADAEAALMKVSSSSSSYPKEIQLTTSTEHNKIVSNAYAFDANSENICFDVRSHVGGHVFDGDLIQLVDVNTKEVKTVLRTVHEAKCGVALFHPFDENVLCCIVGPRHPTEEWAYCAHHRRGYVIDLSEDSNVDSSTSSSNAQQLNSSRSLSSNLEARDLVSPFTKGALRGGTHVHAFSPDGALVSMTYEDAILADATDVNVSRLNARNIAVTIYKDIVEIDKSRNDRNVSGGFTVCVTETTPDPTLGSDEISRAYEDCWMDSRTLSFLGDCRDECGNVLTELFVVELPRDMEKLKEEEDKEERLLQGTLTSYPKPPKSVKQRRVTRSSGCQGSVRFWPRANPADSNVVCILLRDEKASFQLHLVDATTGEIEQLSFLKDGEEVNSAFSWSPDGLYVCFATSTNRIARTFTRGGARKYQTEYLTPPQNTTNDDNKIRPECVCVSPNGKFVCFLKTTTTSSPTKIVRNVSDDKEEGKGKGSEHPRREEENPRQPNLPPRATTKQQRDRR